MVSDRRAQQFSPTDRQVIGLVPWRRAVTGGVQADQTILVELASRGRRIETIYFADAPGAGLGRWWRRCVQFNLDLFRKHRNAPPGTIFLADQALSNVLPLFGWYVHRSRRARMVLLVYHLAFNQWRNPIRRAVWRWIEGATARRADLLIASSESARGELLALGVSPDRITVVPLGITRRAGSLRPRTARENGVLRLLTVGTVEPRKGMEYLLRALAGLQDCDWRLDVAGATDAAYLVSLRGLAGEEGIADRVEFHGRVNDDTLETLFASADIFVSASLWEGFGLAVIEAMDRGLPVVASDAGALAELIDHERTGLLVPSADPAALGLALRRLMRNPELRARLGSAGALQVRDRFSWEVTGRQIDEALSSL